MKEIYLETCMFSVSNAFPKTTKLKKSMIRKTLKYIPEFRNLWKHTEVELILIVNNRIS